MLSPGEGSLRSGYSLNRLRGLHIAQLETHTRVRACLSPMLGVVLSMCMCARMGCSLFMASRFPRKIFAVELRLVWVCRLVDVLMNLLV